MTIDSFRTRMDRDLAMRMAKIDLIRQRLLADPHKPSDGLLRLMLQSMEEKYSRLVKAMSYVADLGVGSILTDSHGSRYALLLPDVSAGGFRSQIFNADGFIGHATRSSLYDVVVDAVDNGFFIPDTDNVGRRMMASAGFMKGNAYLSIIQCVNSGRLSMEQAYVRVTELDSEFQDDGLSCSAEHIDQSLHKPF